MQLNGKIKSISYIKAHASEVINEVAETGCPVIVTQNGEGTAVLSSLREYEQQQETLALLKLVALGRREIRNGQVKPFTAAFKEIDTAIARRKKDMIL